MSASRPTIQGLMWRADVVLPLRISLPRIKTACLTDETGRVATTSQRWFIDSGPAAASLFSSGEG